MKKMITLILALTCLFSLAACGKQGGAGSASEPAAEDADALAVKDAEYLAEALKLWDQESDDLAFQAKDFSLTRELYDNRVEAAMLSGISREEAEQYVLGYVVVKTMYSAALEAGIKPDDAAFQEHVSTNRQYIEGLIASDNPDDGSHYVKVFFDEMEKLGIVEDYWKLNTDFLWVSDTIALFTQNLHDSYVARAGENANENTWMQLCIEFTRDELKEQNVQFASDISWELTGANYHSDLWPAL